MQLYLRPTSLGEALEALGPSGPAPGTLTVLAGGTEVYPASAGRPLAEDILDLAAVPELHGIEECCDHIRIGALATWRDLTDADLPPGFEALERVAREIGGPQIQNTGTVCGNLCGAASAADGVPPLLTLEARVELSSLDGVASLPLDAFILGERRTALGPDQLMTAVLAPKPAPGARSHFVKLGARSPPVIAIVSVAALVAGDGAGRVGAARLAVGACSALPQRLPALEAALRGRPLDRALGAAVEPRHLAGLEPVDDVRASADYRLEAVAVLLRRILGELGGRA